MHRTDGLGHENNLFTQGDPVQSKLPTVITPEWLNDIQESLCRLVERAGISLTKGDYDQLWQAFEYYGVASGLKGYATKADMDADLTPPDQCVAIVTNDTTADNNWTYRKSGASGAGSWVKASTDRVAEVEGKATKADYAARAPWIKNDTVTSFSANEEMVVSAIRGVKHHAPVAGETYKIAFFYKDDPTYFDRISITRGDGTVIASTQYEALTKTPGELTEVHCDGSNPITLWIDYDKITTTGQVLSNSGNFIYLDPLSERRTDLLEKRTRTTENYLLADWLDREESAAVEFSDVEQEAISAIDSIRVEAPARLAGDYYLANFYHDDATYLDKITIFDGNDNIIATTGSVSIAKVSGGLTEVFCDGTHPVTLWVNYDKLTTTGELIRQGNWPKMNVSSGERLAAVEISAAAHDERHPLLTVGKNKFNSANTTPSMRLLSPGIPDPGTLTLSEFIPVIGGQSLTINRLRQIAEYDIDKVVIDDTYLSNPAQAPETRTLTASAAYVRITVDTADAEAGLVQVEDGGTVTDIEPYQETLKTKQGGPLQVARATDAPPLTQRLDRVERNPPNADGSRLRLQNSIGQAEANVASVTAQFNALLTQLVDGAEIAFNRTTARLPMLADVAANGGAAGVIVNAGGMVVDAYGADRQAPANQARFPGVCVQDNFLLHSHDMTNAVWKVFSATKGGGNTINLTAVDTARAVQQLSSPVPAGADVVVVAKFGPADAGKAVRVTARVNNNYLYSPKYVIPATGGVVKCPFASTGTGVDYAGIVNGDAEAKSVSPEGIALRVVTGAAFGMSDTIIRTAEQPRFISKGAEYNPETLVDFDDPIDAFFSENNGSPLTQSVVPITTDIKLKGGGSMLLDSGSPSATVTVTGRTYFKLLPSGGITLWVYAPQEIHAGQLKIMLGQGGFTNYVNVYLDLADHKGFYGWRSFTVFPQLSGMASFGAPGGAFDYSEPITHYAVSLIGTADNTQLYLAGLNYANKGKGRLVFTWDDGTDCNYLAFQALQVHGFAGTSFLVPYYIDQAYSGYLSATQREEMYAAGWEFGSHTYDHSRLSDLTPAEQTTTLELGRDWLLDNGYQRAANYLAYPYGQWEGTLPQVEAAGVAGAVSLMDGLIDCQVGAMNPLLYPRAINLTLGVDLQRVKNAIDAAVEQGCTLIIIGHKTITGGEQVAGDWFLSDLQAVAAYAADYVNQGVLEVQPFAEWCQTDKEVAYQPNVPLSGLQGVYLDTVDELSFPAAGLLWQTDFSGQLFWTPDENNQGYIWLFGTYTDAANYFGLRLTATSRMELVAAVDGVEHLAGGAFSYVAGVQYDIRYRISSESGLTLWCDGVRFPDVALNCTSIPIGETLYFNGIGTGSAGGSGQFSAPAFVVAECFTDDVYTSGIFETWSS